MDELTNISYEAVSNYFTLLSKVGYADSNKVNKLLLLLFLEEFLEEYKYCITEEDYNTISRILACLEGSSCLIPYIRYRENSEPIQKLMQCVSIRLSEDMDSRNTEDLNVRLTDI